MNDRRPHEWNQWAEVVGREPRKSRFVGDMPHGWVASDYGRSLLDMFAFERPADETLVLMAGVPKAWTEQEGFSVKNLRTPFGPLTYSLRVEDDQVVLDVAEINMPNGGLAVAWPEGDQPQSSDHSTAARRAGSARSCASRSCRSPSCSRAGRAINERLRRAPRRSMRSRASKKCALVFGVRFSVW